MEELQVSLEKSQSTIEKQTKVIRDLHATRIKIESSLKEQIEDKEIKLEEIEGKLKVTLVDKILFDTGKVEILRYTATQDVGKAIYPSYVEGQIQGVLRPTGIRPKFTEKFEVMGITLPPALFGFQG